MNDIYIYIHYAVYQIESVEHKRRWYYDWTWDWGRGGILTDRTGLWVDSWGRWGQEIWNFYTGKILSFYSKKRIFNKFAVGKVSLGKSKYVLQMSPPQRHNFLRHRFYKLCCLFNETEHALIVKFQENCRQIWASIGKVLFDTTWSFLTE